MDDVARRGRIRSKDWSRISHGLYVVDADDLHASLGAWRLVLPPGGAFTHLTAARARGWWLPPLPARLPFVVAVPHTGSRPRRSGLHVVRPASAFEVETHRGLPLTSATETLLACARDVGLLDLVVLADAAVHLGHVSLEELRAASAARRRGAPLLRRALPWCDGRAESAWESLLRVLHVSADVPVVPQHEVRHEGRFVARGDLWLEGTTTLHEYDGGYHRTPTQQRKDLARDRRLLGATWTRRGYTAVEVLHEAAGIVRDADSALGRPHDPRRVQRWHRMVADSMFSTRGRERLALRLGNGSRTTRDRADTRRS
jgi:hypothetical protein